MATSIDDQLSEMSQQEWENAMNDTIWDRYRQNSYRTLSYLYNILESIEKQILLNDSANGPVVNDEPLTESEIDEILDKI